MDAFSARVWLQAFWDKYRRLPYRREIPAEHGRYFPGGRTPVGWELELRLADELKGLGLYVYPYSAELDQRKVDLVVEFGDCVVDIQLKAHRNEPLDVRLAGWHQRSPYLWVTVPYDGGPLLPREVEAVVGGMLRVLDLDYAVVPAWAPKRYPAAARGRRKK